MLCFRALSTEGAGPSPARRLASGVRASSARNSLGGHSILYEMALGVLIKAGCYGAHAKLDRRGAAAGVTFSHKTEG
jgi:hypothetical protein